MHVEGNQNVLIRDVAGSQIRITFDGRARDVPLEPAVVPPGRKVQSPARLLRARSGVLPFAACGGVLNALEGWLGNDEPFAGMVVGGRGGSGKTRLGVALCERAAGRKWLAGLLARTADPAAVETLAHAPTARLVVVDYAESRVDQLAFLLPLLAERASAVHPVRVLLLVRGRPREGAGWTDALRFRRDALDAVLDDVDECSLDDSPLGVCDRRAL